MNEIMYPGSEDLYNVPRSEGQEHDYAIAQALLEETHEDLCHLEIRTQYVSVGTALKNLRTTVYMLTGE